MLKHKRKLICALLALNGYAATSTFAAEEAVTMAEPDWTFPTSVSLVSDYIFRGQSQTWGRPAAQFSFEVDHKTGFYAGFFASNVSDHWLPGAHVETDYYGGFRGKLPGAASAVGFDVGAIYYGYPGANWDESDFPGTKSNRLDTVEAYVALNYKWLTFKTGRTLTEYWGWNTNNSPVGGGFAGDLGAGVTGDTKGSYFYELNGSYDVIESWNLNGQVGRQIIANSTGLDITYYKVGVTKSFTGGWAAGIAYSGTNEPDAYKNFLSLANGFRNPSSDSDIARDKVFVTLTKSF